MIAHDRYEGVLSCGRNQGDGTFTFAAADTVPTGGRPTAFILGDVDADGALDALVANSGTNTVSILRGDGQGWFRPARDAGLRRTAPRRAGPRRLDGDGRIDLVVASEHVTRSASSAAAETATSPPARRSFRACGRCRSRSPTSMPTAPRPRDGTGSGLPGRRPDRRLPRRRARCVRRLRPGVDDARRRRSLAPARRRPRSRRACRTRHRERRRLDGDAGPGTDVAWLRVRRVAHGGHAGRRRGARRRRHRS